MTLKDAIKLFNNTVINNSNISNNSNKLNEAMMKLNPQFNNGKWLKPKISARQKALIIKSVDSMIAGMEGFVIVIFICYYFVLIIVVIYLFL